jgi:fructose-specific phosphotransferase system IIC component
MKKILPDSRKGCWRLALLPFKVYIVVAMVAVGFVASGHFENLDYRAAGSLRADHTRFVSALFNGYLVSVAALLLGAVLLRFERAEKQAVRSALIYAAIGVLLMGFLWPATYIPPVK